MTNGDTPHSGYAVKTLLVDGVDAGAGPSYTFVNVTSNHAISVTFANPVTPFDAGDGDAGAADGGTDDTTDGGRAVGGANGCSCRIEPGSNATLSPLSVLGLLVLALRRRIKSAARNRPR